MFINLLHLINLTCLLDDDKYDLIILLIKLFFGFLKKKKKQICQKSLENAKNKIFH